MIVLVTFTELLRIGFLRGQTVQQQRNEERMRQEANCSHSLHIVGEQANEDHLDIPAPMADMLSMEPDRDLSARTTI
jgi:hypothetical protein